MIQIVNGSKYYLVQGKKKRVLNHLSLHIKKGEFVAIMGPSGGGKTTLLNIIAGYDFLTSGQYYYQGKLIQKWDIQQIQQKEIGMLFQDYQLLEHLSVQDNLLLGCYYGQVKMNPERFQDVCQALKITDLLQQPTILLSGGEKQRVALGRLLLAKKSLILADEPTGALDPKNSRKIMEIFQSLACSGKTIVVVTHDQEVAQWCDRIIFLENGYVS